MSPLPVSEESRAAHPLFGKNALCVSSGMMEESPRYGDWIASAMRSHLRGHVLEVGCGHGAYTRAYAGLPNVRHVTGVDIESEAIATAKRHYAQPDIDFLCADALSLPPASYDSLVCANVIEHIADDTAFLQGLRPLLKPDGTAVILVPAHEWLYARYDVEAGHYRRYTASRLRSATERAGYRIDKLFAFNAIGALGWWYAFRWRQSQAVQEQSSRTLIRLFDSYCIPLGRALEKVCPPPFGLSLIALCKSAT